MEIAQLLFDPTSLEKTLVDLNEIEKMVLRELVICGGRANSRDLALYLTYAGLLPLLIHMGSSSKHCVIFYC